MKADSLSTENTEAGLLLCSREREAREEEAYITNRLAAFCLLEAHIEEAEKQRKLEGWERRPDAYEEKREKCLTDYIEAILTIHVWRWWYAVVEAGGRWRPAPVVSQVQETHLDSILHNLALLNLPFGILRSDLADVPLRVLRRWNFAQPLALWHGHLLQRPTWRSRCALWEQAPNAGGQVIGSTYPVPPQSGLPTLLPCQYLACRLL